MKLKMLMFIPVMLVVVDMNVKRKNEMKEWQFCAYCGDEVDTGWECNGCGADWMPYAYPWWKRLFDKIKWSKV